MLRINSVTSSLTPWTVENSCKTPSILTEVGATPGRDDNNILLKAFPNVIPYPLSSGSTTYLPYVPSSLDSIHSIIGFSISNIDKPSLYYKWQPYYEGNWFYICIYCDKFL